MQPASGIGSRQLTAAARPSPKPQSESTEAFDMCDPLWKSSTNPSALPLRSGVAVDTQSSTRFPTYIIEVRG